MKTPKSHDSEGVYIVTFEDENKERKEERFKKRSEVEDFLKSSLGLSDSEVKALFSKRGKISKKCNIEVRKAIQLTSSSRGRKSLLIFLRTIWRSGFTKIERVMLEGLEDIGFKEDEDFVVQYPVKEAGRMYILDFAFPEEKIDIECDGRYWHKLRSKKDKERDEFLRSKGWCVLRFNDKEIKENLEEVLETIKSKVMELRSKL